MSSLGVKINIKHKIKTKTKIDKSETQKQVYNKYIQKRKREAVDYAKRKEKKKEKKRKEEKKFLNKPGLVPSTLEIS